MDGTYSTIDEEWFDTQLTFGDIDIECASLPSWLGVLRSSCTVVTRCCVSGVITLITHFMKINTKV